MNPSEDLWTATHPLQRNAHTSLQTHAWPGEGRFPDLHKPVHRSTGTRLQLLGYGDQRGEGELGLS